MKERKNWACLYDVLDMMNQVSSCLILRNYEDITNDQYYMDGHDDIDFLCDNPKAIMKALDVRKNVFWKSKDHYYVKIAGKDVKIGLRYLGDDYYDRLWEKSALDNKVKLNDHFFVMDKENYFYSLLFHALLQKKKLSDDYKKRLISMGNDIGLELKGDSDFHKCLFDYMRKMNYSVVYPKDITVSINYKKVPNDLIRGKNAYKIRRFFGFYRRVIGKISNMTAK